MNGEIHWSPTGPGFGFRDLPEAPPPAPTAETRLLQMNEMIKRFSAVAHPEAAQDLRLLPDPVDRYSDAQAGQVDGAIFLLSIGDNPEVIILVEAQGQAADKATWRYAIAPATAAPFEVSIDGKKVWSAPYHSEERNTPTGSYFIVGIPRRPKKG
jgi:hypothetical protein